MENTKENNTKRKEKKYYDRLVSNGDNLAILFILSSIIEFILAFKSFAEFHLGICFLLIISGIGSILFGLLISKVCIYMAERAKNDERQTELLEKLIEKLDTK